MLNQFSIELGLTEQQKQQILPFLQDEAKQLEALKKNTSLKPLEKIRTVEEDRRRHRCQGHATPRSAAAAEVPGHSRRASARADREDGQPGDAEGGSQGQAGDVEPEVRQHPLGMIEEGPCIGSSRRSGYGTASARVIRRSWFACCSAQRSVVRRYHEPPRRHRPDRLGWPAGRATLPFSA